MGEQADYEQMFNEMNDEEGQEIAAADKAFMERMAAQEQHYKEQSGDWWQPDCPFRLKDIVKDDGFGEGKVIGLPEKAVMYQDDNYCHVWVYFSADCSRRWVPWGHVTHVRRSPPRAKRAQSFPTEAARNKSVQQKLFSTSRTAFQEAAGDDLPDMASIERDRKPAKKPPMGKRGRATASRSTKQSKVSVPKRLNQFPDQSFRDSCGLLFCGGCLCQLPNIKSTIETHIATKKHKANLIKFNEKTSDDFAVMQELGEYFAAHPEEAGGTVKPETNLFRFRVTESFMYAGIAPAKIDMLRALLQRAGQPLTQRAHMMRMVPKVEAKEFATVLDEITDMYCTAIFDGTTRVGEALNVIVRYCTADFYVVQRLVAFITLQKHMNATQMANLLMQLFLTKLQMKIENLVATARDSASVNGAAVRRLGTTFTNAANILCVCHTLSIMGGKFDFPELEEFTSVWVSMVYSHAGIKTIWKHMVEEEVVGFSNIRWYCKAEIIMQIAKAFGHVGPFLAMLEQLNYAPTLQGKLSQMLSEKKPVIKLQAAAILDMRVVVSTTYTLEGDGGALLLLAYPLIENIRHLGRNLASEGSLPNVEAVLRNSAELKRGLIIKKVFVGYGNCEATIVKIDRADSTLYPGVVRTVYTVKYTIDGVEEDLEEEELRPLIFTENMPERKPIVEGLQKGFDYLESRLTGNCHEQFSCVETYQIFRLAQIFDPSFAATTLTPAMVDDLVAIKPLAGFNLVAGLKKELPAYLVAAASCGGFNRTDPAEYSIGLLKWWRINNPPFPTWAKAARIIFAMAPSSAASERVFSLVNNMFGKEQLTSLADFVQGSLMLRYNQRNVG